MKNEVFCTVGPSSLNSHFLKSANKLKVDLLRINMSHVSIVQLEKNIKFIRKFTNIPICIDTEGAQIRTKVKKPIYLRAGKSFKIFKNNNKFKLYPEEIFKKLKVRDLLSIGFSGLEARIIKKNNNYYNCKVGSSGKLETNKGLHILNRKIDINFLTKKDF